MGFVNSARTVTTAIPIFIRERKTPWVMVAIRTARVKMAQVAVVAMTQAQAVQIPVVQIPVVRRPSIL